MTVWVYSFSCFAVKGTMTEALPVCMAGTYSIDRLLLVTGHLNGLGPFRLGREPLPLPFRTNRRPSRSARTVVGYQPVGMYPVILLSLPETSATAIAFASEHA